MPPYKSQAQAGFFHTNPEKVGGAKVVKEFDQATKGKHLPKRKKKKEKAAKSIMQAVSKKVNNA